MVMCRDGDLRTVPGACVISSAAVSNVYQHESFKCQCQQYDAPVEQDKGQKDWDGPIAWFASPVFDSWTGSQPPRIWSRDHAMHFTARLSVNQSVMSSRTPCFFSFSSRLDNALSMMSAHCNQEMSMTESTMSDDREREVAAHPRQKAAFNGPIRRYHRCALLVHHSLPQIARLSDRIRFTRPAVYR
jgi:hypothetical protein